MKSVSPGRTKSFICSIGAWLAGCGGYLCFGKCKPKIDSESFIEECKPRFGNATFVYVLQEIAAGLISCRVAVVQQGKQLEKREPVRGN